MMNKQQSRQEEVRQEELRREEEARRDELQAQDRVSLESVVRESVMYDLGEPAGLHRVQVRHLWGRHFRVNVFVGPDAVSSRVAHSYFVEANGGGKLLSSSP